MLDKPQLIAFERNLADMWEAAKINCPLHLSGGNEDKLIAIFKEIKNHDYVFSGHRGHYHALLHGVPPMELLAAISGTNADARGRSMGYINHHYRYYSSAIVGGMCAPAVGVAWALKHKRNLDPLSIDEHSANPRVWCFVGDGAVDGGHFWESLNYAYNNDLPITFVIEDNDRATCSSKKNRGADFGLWASSKFVKYYKYVPAWPHVGTGVYVQF